LYKAVQKIKAIKEIKKKKSKNGEIKAPIFSWTGTIESHETTTHHVAGG
jgi:hypothetical protein